MQPWPYVTALLSSLGTRPESRWHCGKIVVSYNRCAHGNSAKIGQTCSRYRCSVKNLQPLIIRLMLMAWDDYQTVQSFATWYLPAVSFPRKSYSLSQICPGTMSEDNRNYENSTSLQQHGRYTYRVKLITTMHTNSNHSAQMHIGEKLEPCLAFKSSTISSTLVSFSICFFCLLRLSPSESSLCACFD